MLILDTCIFCGEDILTSAGEQRELLRTRRKAAPELDVLLLIRNTSLRVEELSEYLKTCKNIARNEDWVKRICGHCYEHVTSINKLYHEMQRIVKRFNEAKLWMEKKMRERIVAMSPLSTSNLKEVGAVVVAGSDGDTPVSIKSEEEHHQEDFDDVDHYLDVSSNHNDDDAIAGAEDVGDFQREKERQSGSQNMLTADKSDHFQTASPTQNSMISNFQEAAVITCDQTVVNEEPEGTTMILPSSSTRVVNPKKTRKDTSNVSHKTKQTADSGESDSEIDNDDLKDRTKYLSCPCCGTTAFHDLSDFSRHVDICATQGSPKFKDDVGKGTRKDLSCPCCRKRAFQNLSEFCRHVEVCAKPGSQQSKDDDNDGDDDDVAKDTTEYLSCPCCRTTEFYDLSDFCRHVEGCAKQHSSKFKNLLCTACKQWICRIDQMQSYLEHVLKCCEDPSVDKVEGPAPWRHGVVPCSICQYFVPLKWFAEHVYTYHQHHYSCTRCSVRKKIPEKLIFTHWTDYHNEHVKTTPKKARYRRDLQLPEVPRIPWFCPFLNCGKIFWKEEERDAHLEADEHMQTEVLVLPHKSLECMFCEKKCYTSEELKMHRVIAHVALLEAGTAPEKCEMCSRYFEDNRELGRHKTLKHRPKKVEQTNEKIKTKQCDKCKFHCSMQEDLDKHKEICDGDPKIACKYCDKKFYVEKYLKVHMRVKHPLFCRICKIDLESNQNLKLHMQSAHPGEEELDSFPCTAEGCDQVFIKKHHLEVHVAKHHEKKHLYFCKECGKGFYRLPNLRTHEANHVKPKHNKEIVNLYPCPTCKRMFQNQSNFKRHRKKCTLENLGCRRCQMFFTTHDDFIKHRKEVHNIVSYLARARQPAICQYCGKYFPRRLLWQKHVRSVHEKKQCEECGKEVGLTSWKSHMAEKHGIGGIKCDSEGCDRSFYDKAKLLRHKANVHDDPIAKQDLEQYRVQCDRCPATFAAKEKLMKHIKVRHEEDSWEIKCDLCEKRFPNNTYLRKHKASAHGIGDYKCEYAECSGKVFGTKGTLRRHIRLTHENQKPVKNQICGICGKAFSSKYKLDDHQEAVHINKDSKPYECHLCGKNFASMRYVQYHLKGTHKIGGARVRSRK